MPWLEMKLDVHPDNAEEFEQLLMEAGASAVTLEDGADQPLFEPELGSTPLWDQTRITGLFEAGADLAQVRRQLESGHAEVAPGTPFPPCKVEILEDKDWEREWMDNFHPMQFGPRLWVCPSWKPVADPDAANLMLDPGLAFGTGTHPTTALCLEWLATLPLEGATVLDYGCGSGILGIAALLLGAKRLIATDIDPQALEATEQNAARNQIDPGRLELYYPRQLPEVEADVLVANILAGPLVELAPELATRVRPGGRLALSGVLSSQQTALEQAYLPWFDLDAPVAREEWIRLTGTRLR
ncbi:50S ribosomal protein L11 methyltransferase [Motiliproteus sp. SC1-56]|uniref:50S ribosomal protein L11 methyltransferase n=1 Tax=Motiliproteus sp. SC1-56 TaxID=2799565 RepID=UPI001A90C876|nr:50S ribosomal protein L11 methyltransferase [Motiliproteus sp. SC1-56]